MSETLKPNEPFELPIVWEIPDDLGMQYANNLLVQHTEQEFIISFFQMAPPLLIGTPEEIESQLKEIGGIRSRCIARIVVSPSKMEDFVRALQGSVGKYHAKFVDVESLEESQ